MIWVPIGSFVVASIASTDLACYKGCAVEGGANGFVVSGSILRTIKVVAKKFSRVGLAVLCVGSFWVRKVVSKLAMVKKALRNLVAIGPWFRMRRNDFFLLALA